MKITCIQNSKCSTHYRYTTTYSHGVQDNTHVKPRLYQFEENFRLTHLKPGNMTNKNQTLGIVLLLAIFMQGCAGNDSTTETSTSGVDTLSQEPITHQESSTDLVQFTANLNAKHYLSPSDDRTAYVYLEVKTGEYEAEGERAPLNLSLVIDRSGSMRGEKLEYVKKAGAFVVEHLSEKDRISVVSYDDDVVTNWKSGPITNKKQIQNVIERIVDGGATNLSGGMLEGYSQAKPTYASGFTNRVLLLSDGIANRGITSEAGLNNIAMQQNRENGITLSTFGVGADYNEDLMQNLAEHGSGNYYFIKNPDEIPEIFKREMDGLLSVVAQNAELAVTLPNGVTVERVYGYLHTQTGNELKIGFRDLFASETKGVLIKLQYGQQAKEALNISAALSYTDATKTYDHQTLQANANMQFTNNEELASAGVNKDVEQWITFFESNDLMEQAMRMADAYDFDEAEILLEKNAEFLDIRKNLHGTSAYLEKQDSINTSYKDQVDSAEEMSEYELKMMQKSNKSMNYDLRKIKGK